MTEKRKPMYWAARPMGQPDIIRISHNKVTTLKDAVRECFGTDPYGYEGKPLTPRVAELQSDNKRMAMLNDPEGWHRMQCRTCGKTLGPGERLPWHMACGRKGDRKT